MIRHRRLVWNSHFKSTESFRLKVKMTHLNLVSVLNSSVSVSVATVDVQQNQHVCTYLIYTKNYWNENTLKNWVVTHPTKQFTSRCFARKLDTLTRHSRVVSWAMNKTVVNHPSFHANVSMVVWHICVRYNYEDLVSHLKRDVATAIKKIAKNTHLSKNCKVHFEATNCWQRYLYAIVIYQHLQ